MRVANRWKRLMRVVCFGAAVSAGCAAGWTAEIQSANTAADKPGSAYLKKIPGSSTVIQGSQPRTYLKPKKMTYQQHLESIGAEHRFKDKSAATVSPRTADSVAVPSGVLTSSQPPTSSIQIQRRVGRPASGVARNQPLSNDDFLFLGKLAESARTQNPQAAARLNRIIAGQQQNRTFDKGEYDFLMNLSKQIDDTDTAYRLHSIAEKRRETLY